jgi:hypothetical protein
MQTQAEVMLNNVNAKTRVLDKERPGLGSVRGVNLVAVRPTTIQLTNHSFRVVT